MKLGDRFIRVALFVFMLVVFCNASAWVVASPGAAAGGSDGSFCSRPTIQVPAGATAFKVRLGLNKKSVRPGGGLRIRVENLGTQDVAYGLAYELARFEKGIWIKLPTGPFFAPRFVVPAGSASSCQKVQIPRHAPPGLYRIRKVVRPAAPSGDQRRVVTATFRVF
jgi:hypothetical protein